MINEIEIRNIAYDDVDKISEFERKTHTYIDEDFDVPVCYNYAWSSEDIRKAIRQHKTTDGDKDTRGIVAETISSADDVWGEKRDDKKLSGCLIYEIHDEGYEILLLSVDPVYEIKDKVRSTLIDYLKNKIKESKTKHYIKYYLPDTNDVDNVYGPLKFFKKQNWNIKLSPERNSYDSWLCEYAVEKKNPKGLGGSSLAKV